MFFAIAKLIALVVMRYSFIWVPVFGLAGCFFLYVALQTPTPGVRWILAATLAFLVVIPVLYKRHANRLTGIVAIVMGGQFLMLPTVNSSWQGWVGGLGFVGYGLYSLITNRGDTPIEGQQDVKADQPDQT